MAKIKVTNPKQIINGGAKKYYFKVKGVGGIKGDKGDKGDTGSQGPQGPQGNAATIEVGSTTTLPTGYDATVTNTGTINNAILNFGIPRGIKGDTGAKGDKGDKGDKGEQGNTGPQGPAGQNATVYIGTTTTGAPGTQASVYNSGTDRNATLNFTIPQGAKGDTGATGATGPQGPAGQDGQNFTPTIVETLPTTGDQSKLYLTPKNYTTGTATGNPITISLGEDAGQITSAQLDGDTYQQTYTGKNLFNKSNYHELACWITNSGVLKTGNNWTFWIPCLPNTTYTIQKMVQQPTGKNRFQIATSSVQPEIGTQTSGRWSGADGDTTTSHAYTTAADANYLIFNVGNYDPNPATTTTKNELLGSIQVELGSTATSYEPFVGGQASPNPDYPQAIQTVTGEQTVNIRSKNLFVTPPSGENRGVTYTRNQDGTYSITGKATGGESFITAITDKITIQNGDSIYLSSTSDNADLHYRVEAYNGNTWLSVIAAQSYNMPIVVSLPSNTTRLRFGIGIADGAEVNLSNVGFQLEKSSSASAYVPYSSTDYPISLGSIELCKLGTYQDYIYKSGSDWKVHKATNKAILDGSSFGGWALTTGATGYTRADTASSIGFPSYDGYCDKLTTRTGAHGGYEYIWFQPEATGRIYIQVMTSRLSDNTIEGFNSWLNDAKPTAYYTLSTPTDTTITDQTLIAQLEAIRTASLENGANTITNTATGTNLAGDLELGYCEYDPTNRYDKWLWLDLNNNYEKLGS